ncbi:MAG: response regulator [Clostridiaceae bacterium]|nr:response regulator [Clostridiaceae bacterium]
MYSVMIVDDEPIIRMGLRRTVNWENFGFKVICECRDGEEALEQLEEHKIDFIVTDIKMHKISGLEMLKILRTKNLDIPVLLLSGYDEFAYAQEGLRLGAFDYILKPLDHEKLEDILTNVYKKLATTEKKNNEFNINRTITSEKILYDLLRGKNLMVMDEYISRYNLPLIKNKVQVAIVEINEIVINNEELIESDERDYLEKSVSLIIEKEMKNSGLGYYSILDDELGKKFIIAQTDLEIEASEFDDIFGEALKAILRISNEELETVLNIGMGNVYNQLFSIHKSYLNAKEALKYKYVLGTNKLIHINQLAGIRREKFNYPIEKEKALISSIISAKDDSLGLLDGLLKEIAQIMNFDVFKINMIVTQLINNIYSNVLKKYSFLDTVYNLSEIMRVGFLGVETLVDIEKRLMENVASLINIIKEYNLNQGDNIVLKACEYVLNHVEEDITLTSISNNLNISKNYFCSIFKQQTGKNFLEYLTRAKMDRAKILLKRQDYKVYEVSDVLGYKETAYFSKLFKKHTGYNPAEYRKSGN